MLRPGTSTSCPFELDPTIRSVPQRIVGAVLAALERGDLVDGDSLPSTRQFAKDYQVSRSSVVQAYETLSGIGVVQAIHGSGTRVSQGTRSLLSAEDEPPAEQRDNTSTVQASAVNLTVPATSEFSVINIRDWKKAWRAAIDPASIGSGVSDARSAVIEHLRSFRGIHAEQHRLFLRPSLGSTVDDLVHGLDLRGRGVAMEDPGYPQMKRHFVAAGCRVHCVPVDDSGPQVELLTSDDRLAHVMPARHWPTGVTMSECRRDQLLDWAVRTGGVIVENDMDAEFTYGHAPPRSLFADAPSGARVIYVGSSSKLISPELAVVWMVANWDFSARPYEMAPVSDFSARALANYIVSGALYRQRNRALSLFGDRREALVRALATYAPSVRCLGEASGTELAIRLPSHAHELTVQLRLEEVGFQVSTLGDFAVRRQPPTLVLQYGGLTPTQAITFAQSLAACLTLEHSRAQMSSKQSPRSLNR